MGIDPVRIDPGIYVHTYHNGFHIFKAFLQNIPILFQRFSASSLQHGLQLLFFNEFFLCVRPEKILADHW